MRLLLIEDDLILQDGLERSFSTAGYAVDVMSDLLPYLGLEVHDCPWP